MSTTSSPQRVVSGMRATGSLHLGHYHGVLKNNIQLQHEYECFFSIVDLHALTTHYEDPRDIERNVWNMLIDWLAAGINPGSAHIFIQSQVPEIAELHLLLSMMTPLSWAERVPTYREQQEKIKDKDLATYGFLGYPVLQTADILICKADLVSVGEDQQPHLELSREIARRFNHLYGRDDDFVERAEKAIDQMGKKAAKVYRNMRRRYQEQGDKEALEAGRALVDNQRNLSVGDVERLLGYLEGSGKIILPEPQTLLTHCAKMPGLDGQKMSKSYNNYILLREEPEVVEKKVKTMQTDPARVRREDPGTPERCPVWGLHDIYSANDVKDWVQKGCTTAGIGCLDCKKPLIDAICKEQAPIVERGKEYEENPSLLRNIVAEGREAAREMGSATLKEVREAMHIDYR